MRTLNRLLLLSAIACCSIDSVGQQRPAATSPPRPNTQSLILEYSRAIYVLNLGLQRGWTQIQQYFSAFDAANMEGSEGDSLTAAQKEVYHMLELRLLPPVDPLGRPWDEHIPGNPNLSRSDPHEKPDLNKRPESQIKLAALIEDQIEFFIHERDLLLEKDFLESKKRQKDESGTFQY